MVLRIGTSEETKISRSLCSHRKSDVAEVVVFAFRDLDLKFYFEFHAGPTEYDLSAKTPRSVNCTNVGISRNPRSSVLRLGLSKPNHVLVEQSLSLSERIEALWSQAVQPKL